MVRGFSREAEPNLQRGHCNTHTHTHRSVAVPVFSLLAYGTGRNIHVTASHSWPGLQSLNKSMRAKRRVCVCVCVCVSVSVSVCVSVCVFFHKVLFKCFLNAL